MIDPTNRATPVGDIADVLSTHGITRSTSEVFHVGDYQYSKLADAVAQSKRTHSVTDLTAHSDWHTW